MDFQTLFNAGLGVVSVVVLPTLSMLFSRIKNAEDVASKAKSDLQEYKTKVAEDYVSVKRFEGFEERLFGELKAIKDKLDDKADK